MAPLDDWPRARPRFAMRALRAVPALLSLAVLGGCVGPGPVLRQFGMVGTFADDCSRSIQAGGARAIYDVPPTGYATFTAVNRYGTFQSKIVRADQVNANTLIMYTNDPGGAWNEIEIQREGNGFMTRRMVSHQPNQYRPIVAVGRGGMADNNGTGLFVERCSNSSLSPTLGAELTGPPR
jgi:hypothetical protein